MREIILSAIVSSIISILMMTIQIKMIKKWLADFFDKQDEWLKKHFENLVKLKNQMMPLIVMQKFLVYLLPRYKILMLPMQVLIYSF